MRIRRISPSIQDDIASQQLQFVHLSVTRMNAGTIIRHQESAKEMGVVLVQGFGELTIGGHDYGTVGRRSSPFDGIPPYVWYVPPGTEWSFVARGEETELAVAQATVNQSLTPPAHLYRPDEIDREVRGEGEMERQVYHLLDRSGQAAQLLLVEVITPGGHWSSFPPHKHDHENPPNEALLEEIYYFRIQPATAWTLQRVYQPDSEGQVFAVYDGDMVLVARGYHPVSSPPGVTTYYLNAMAGPHRDWLFTVDHTFAHVPMFVVPQ